jgi:hypothetical protein
MSVTWSPEAWDQSGSGGIADPTPYSSSASAEFKEALRDAQLLLNYAIENGELSRSEATVNAILMAEEAVRKHQLTRAVANSFWLAFAALSRATAPVTAASLKASEQISLTGIKIRTTLLAAAVIFLSIFVFMGNVTLTDTSDLIDQQNATALKLWSDIQMLRTSSEANSTDNMGGAAHRTGPLIAERVFEETVEFARKNTALLQSAGRLNFWFTPWWMTSSIDDVTFKPGNKNDMDHLNVRPELSTITDTENEALYQIKAYQFIRDYALGLYKINTLIYSSLSTYFLPTIYALLGANLYGFRFYSRLIRRKEFLPSVAHSARYFVAAILGLIIGLFGSLLPKNPPLLPLAVAFLAGYTAEALFSRLDDLIRPLRSLDSASQPSSRTDIAQRRVQPVSPTMSLEGFMDPISAVVTALALGATATIRNIANQKIEDLYGGLKALIKSRYTKIAIEQLERTLDARNCRDVLVADLHKAGAHQDQELMIKAHELIALIRSEALATVATTGIDLDEVEAAGLSLHEIATGYRDRSEQTLAKSTVSATGVKVEEGLSGDFKIDRVQTGGQTPGQSFRTRVLDVNLLGGPIAPGHIVTLTAAILLLGSHRHGAWWKEVEADPAAGPLTFRLETSGFKIISPLPPPIPLPEDEDSQTCSFVLKVLDAMSRWITVIVMQDGRQIASLVITDFRQLEGAEVPGYNAPVRCVRSPDLTLLVRRLDRHVEAYSPSAVLNLHGVDWGELKQPAGDAAKMLRAQLRGLYDPSATSLMTELDMKIIGAQLARCLPADLADVLKSGRVRTLMLHHEDTFDFPFELCFLEDFFVGDVIAICRWYLGVSSFPDVVDKDIGRVAILAGDADASKMDTEMVKEMFGARAIVITSRDEALAKLFGTREFDLVHFVGHCSPNKYGVGCLELQDGSAISVMEIGQIKDISKFSAATPFVMLNGCSTGNPYVTFTGPDSFAHRFVEARACAFIGTLWPVEEAVAGKFARLFYTHLIDGTHTVGTALLRAKKALVTLEVGEQLTEMQKVARYVAARSYCLFANPDLRLRIASLSVPAGKEDNT